MKDRLKTDTLPPPPTIVPRKLSISQVSGPGRWTGEFHQERITIGRDQESDVQLEDTAVSARHVVLQWTGTGLRLISDGRNGTQVNGVKVDRGIIPVSSLIRLGATVLRIEPVDEGVALPRQGFGELVGDSLVMRDLYATLTILARLDISVLIEGKTGTGKELAARALHSQGPRGRGPFIVVDCTNIPVSLAEGTLMGHRKGAFSGADQDRPGPFEEATGGVVFLDEVGELPKDVQSKLLRVLERKEVIRVGESRPRPVDVRIVAATLQDLTELCNQKGFREDLYFRLARVNIRMPGLDERREDIGLLVQSFLTRLSAMTPYSIQVARDITDEAIEALKQAEYPGNIRDLRNTVERLAQVDAQGPCITADDVRKCLERMRRPRTAGTTNSFSGDDPLDPFKKMKDECIKLFERNYLEKLMRRHPDNLSRAAEEADLGRNTLRDLLKKYNLYKEK